VSSPALIEKTRSVVTDGSGQYQIIDLRPGVYEVTFALSGFSTVKREGVELAGSFTATINVEMKVGSVTETVTVSGESPIVDVSGTTQQRVSRKKWSTRFRPAAVISSWRADSGRDRHQPGRRRSNTPG
jgi:hypothetical protein